MDLQSSSGLDKKISRRDFFWYVLVWSSLGASLLSVLRYLRLEKENPQIEPVSLLLPQNLAIGEVKAFPAYQIWLARNQNGFYALRSVCTHMGCTPVWKSSQAVFQCPCHHSFFDAQGIRQKGPAPRSLERHRLFWGKKGEIMLDRSQIFRREMGEWESEGAFLSFSPVI
jgi:cytochrome b6-f complex iron-sulfur subunit